MSSDRDVVLSTLAQRLRLERPLVFLDLETTGTSVESDRIVEVALVKLMPSGDVVRFVALVHPGVPIPGGATAVHGIADEHVAGSPAFAAIAHELAALLAGCDIGGFNVGRFDLRLLSCELERAGVAHALAEARVVDAMTIYHRNERRDLSAAVRFYNGREHDGHRARPPMSMRPSTSSSRSSIATGTSPRRSTSSPTTAAVASGTGSRPTARSRGATALPASRSVATRARACRRSCRKKRVI